MLENKEVNKKRSSGVDLKQEKYFKRKKKYFGFFLEGDSKVTDNAVK